LKSNATNFSPAQLPFDLERRDFFKLLGGGIVLLLAFDHPAAAQESGRGGRGQGLPKNVSAWLHISELGIVTVFTGKTEVGTNIRTSLAQAVAEELRTPIASITLVMADTSLTPYDMGTFGSRTTPTMAPQLRKMAAAARETLIDLAAEKWKVDRASITVADGRLTYNDQSVSFGRIDSRAATHENRGTKQPSLLPDKWTVAGTSVPKTTARDMVTVRTGLHRTSCVPTCCWGAYYARPPSMRNWLRSIPKKRKPSRTSRSCMTGSS